MMLKNLRKLKRKEPTYVAVTLDEDSNKAILDLCKDVPERIDDADIHITVAFSKKPILIDAKGKLDPPLAIKPKHYSLFDTDEGQSCLVLEVESEELVKRHQEIKDDYGASYDHPKYNPHISLSYNVPKKFDLTKLPKVEDLPTLYANKEYSEALDLDWNSKAD